MRRDEVYRDRARAGSFGSVAQQYDRYRPSYPEALLDDLAASRPARVLDVGCGTGKVAVALAGRGLSVLGVEADERMAQVARGHGIEVEVARFETWNDAERRFDLIACGDAWHWIDPELGIAKAARVLRPGGVIAWFWTSCEVDEPVAEAFDAVYSAHAPEVARIWRHPSGHHRDLLAGSDAFSAIEERTYPSQRALTTDEWIGLVATVSDHLRLGNERLTALLRELRVALESLGGWVHARHETTALFTDRL
ncbi:methyltransferase domain-containing protein [Nonomuraea sp. NPDC050786]|uniref:class I SAM-dependent methyltransferase n=1 Tax=Nonomuraea sp. NPDC050786 TaxID=3154840 RepID=UPI0033C1C1A6